MQPLAIMFLLLFASNSSESYAQAKEENNTPQNNQYIEVKKSSTLPTPKNGESHEATPGSAADGLKNMAKGAYTKVFGTRTSKDNRRDSTFTIAWTPVNPGLVFPKTGFSAVWIINQNWTLDPQYLSGGFSLKFSKIDLAEFDESLTLLPLRWYPNTNSFNLKFGLGLRKYTFGVGDQLLSAVADEFADVDIPSLNAFEVSNTILHFGLGNRWQFDNGFTLGIDWLDLYLTIGQGSVKDRLSPYISDPTDQKNLNNLFKVLRYAPTFSVLGLHLAYTF